MPSLLPVQLLGDAPISPLLPWRSPRRRNGLHLGMPPEVAEFLADRFQSEDSGRKGRIRSPSRGDCRPRDFNTASIAVYRVRRGSRGGGDGCPSSSGRRKDPQRERRPCPSCPCLFHALLCDLPSRSHDGGVRGWRFEGSADRAADAEGGRPAI